MKKFYFLSFLLCAFSAFGQTIFVDASASGANNGTSWADAFTSLNEALANVNSGQIWVASGTYSPTTTSSDPRESTFEIPASVLLFGGFSGTETMLNQRDVVANVTILSGDLNNDDIAGVFDANRTDNAIHVVTVPNNGLMPAVVDGFTIRGGYTLEGNTNPDLSRRGGGLLATGAVQVRNCTFTDNFGNSGGGIALLDSLASGSLVRDCKFIGNATNSQSAGVFMRNLSGSEVRRCIFEKNIINNRGCIYPNACSNIVIDSCRFLENECGPDNWGGGFYSWQSSWEMSNCYFYKNQARNGAGMYVDGREGGDFAKLKNCWFEENVNTGYGGTLYNYVSNMEVDGCRFTANRAPTTGAGSYNGSGSQVSFSNTVFEGGNATFATGVACYGEGTMVNFDNCTFQFNTATTSGGGLSVGFLGVANVSNCRFESNTGRWGGAIYVQNDSSSLFVDSSEFLFNAAENNGGAINIGAGVELLLDACYFESNTANYGAAFACEADSVIRPKGAIQNCIFNLNIANIQGGALNIENAKLDIVNCLFSENLNISIDGAGGAISNNGSGVLTSDLTVKNSTFYGNNAPLGSGIANWEADTVTASTVLYLQNTIFANIGDNYAIEDGQPEVFSSGGNISTDASMSSVLIGQNDGNEIMGTFFVDPTNNDYHISTDGVNWLVDRGIAAGAPLTDIEGNPRLGAPDIGAYEWGTLGLFSPMQSEQIEVFPNPTSGWFQVDFSEIPLKKGILTVLDAEGTVVGRRVLENQSALLEFSVSELPNGTYFVLVQGGATSYFASVQVIH